MPKLKTIMQPMEFAKLFDQEVNELLEHGYEFSNNYEGRNIQVVTLPHGGSMLVTFLVKYTED